MEARSTWGHGDPAAEDRCRVRIWASDAREPVVRKLEGFLVLDRRLLGKHATNDPDEAPVLTVTGSLVHVEVRKKRRFVWGLPGRLFDSFPGHPGALGRYWTWVVHPEREEALVLVQRRLPRYASCLEGRARLHRIGVRPALGEFGSALRLPAPCVVVAGLGAVEITMARGSTGLSRPEAIARLDLDELRRRVQSREQSGAELAVPCAVPGSAEWQRSEQGTVAHLAGLLHDAFRATDAPDALLLPCYLPDSVPGMILARRSERGWVFASNSATALERWLCGEGRGWTGPRGLGAPSHGVQAVEKPAPLEVGEDQVLFDNVAMIQAAREHILEGKDYQPRVGRAATRGAWRRAASIYALRMRACASRDLRQCGWSDGMARCVEDLVSALGADTREWFGREDGPRTFAEKFTVIRRGALAADPTEALAALLDELARPHGRTVTRRSPGR